METNVLRIYLSEMKDSVDNSDGQFYKTASKICKGCLDENNQALFPIHFLLNKNIEITYICDMYVNIKNNIVFFLYSRAILADYTEIYDIERIDLYRFCKYLIDKCEKL